MQFCFFFDSSQIHEQDIVCEEVNEIQLKCAGILDGEIVLQISEDSSELYFIGMASNLDINKWPKI